MDVKDREIVEVIFKNGSRGRVYRSEVEGLKKRGKLKGEVQNPAKPKEEKAQPKTKEEKSRVMTKANIKKDGS